MKKRLLLITSLLLVSCNNSNINKEDKLIAVVLENDINAYNSLEYSLNVKKGEDASFIVCLKEGEWIDSCSYENYTISSLGNYKYKLELENILYPTYVKISIASEKIQYFGNGGYTLNNEEQAKFKTIKHHLKENSINDMDLFKKDGYVPIGFNTKSDGSGEHIGFGSRIPYQIDNLYYEWEKETPLDNFTYHTNENGIVLDSFKTNDKKVVIPLSKGKIYLSDYLFNNKNIDTLILSNNVDYVGEHTFDNATINELYITDESINIPGESLDKCNIKKVHINAATNPSYSGTYYDAFQDKMDYLDKIKDEKKFVLFGGSSVRYGYNSEMIRNAFPSYNVVNMGVFAYVNALPQLEIITKYMTNEDYLIHSPEFDNHAVAQQFFMTNKFEYNEFALFESNYEMLSLLDVSNYPTFFTSFKEFLNSRVNMYKLNYSVSAKNYDDDGNYHFGDVYNIYGDMSLYRTGHYTYNEKLSQPYVDHTLENITPEAINSLNEVYDKLKDKGINVLFTYYPKNRYCLSEASTLEKRNELENYINNNLHAPVISKMEDYLYDANYFYLIDNHLSTEGVVIRTNNIINDLKKYGIR